MDDFWALGDRLLGQKVTARLDWPQEHFSLTLRGQKISVTCGVAENMLTGDPKGAYILCPEQGSDRFSGIVVALIRRRDSGVERLVLAPQGMVFDQAEILEAVAFGESFARTRIQCLRQKSCGGILYRWENGNAQLLLVLQKKSNNWSFPKGRVEPYETELETACRELEEEIGAMPMLQQEPRFSVEYDLTEKTRKEVVLFLGQLKGSLHLQETELQEGRWVAVQEARRLLRPFYGPMLDEVERLLSAPKTE